MDSVKIVECPRDAWQGLKIQIPTERKVAYLRALIAAGFRHIDAVSFVSPKAVPQMADSEAVLSELQPPNEVEIIGIVVNEKGAERAIATKAVRTLGYPYSISETFLRRNQNQSPNESEAVMKRIKAMADEAGLEMVVYISMAFGNPYGDQWNETEVAGAARKISDIGIRSISLADTIGAADPELIQRVVAKVLHDDVRSNWACTCTAHERARREKFWRRTMPVPDDSIAQWADWAVVLSRKTNSSATFQPKKFCACWNNAA